MNCFLDPKFAHSPRFLTRLKVSKKCEKISYGQDLHEYMTCRIHSLHSQKWRKKCLFDRQIGNV